MSKQQNGGPAFPPALACTPVSVVIGTDYKGGSGMSLRDWFAGRVLPETVRVFGYKPDEAAASAYEYAEAMLRERDK